MRTLLFVFIIIVFYACSNDGWSSNKENFTQTYMEILIVREQIHDSARAASEVANIMRSHGYDDRSFQEQFMEYTLTPDVLRSILDSAQRRVQRELKR